MAATTLAYTGAAQTYVVPAGVTSLLCECWGAQGGTGTGAGGLGAYAKGLLAVTPGETLYVYVGQQGSATASVSFGGGGAGGGGAAGSGGGASDVRQGGSALANRKIVGAGGGGGGYSTGSGAGGGGGTTTGVTGTAGSAPGAGGNGGTQTAGGAAVTASNAGALGVGGNSSTAAANGGGGGGGGYYGGGSGQSTATSGAGGGGGGSSYVGGVTTTTWTAATRAGAGQVILTPQNAAPSAPTGLTPAGSTVVDRTITQRLSWTPTDPDPGDTQSKFDLQYRLVGAGTWTAVTGTTPNAFYDMPGGTLAAGDYEWQVRTYDAQGAVGPYSASAFFTAATPPSAPTITAPVNGSTIGAASAPLAYSYPTQTNYQVRKVADNAGAADTATVYYDSGDVVDSTSRSVTLAFPVNNRYEHLQVRIKDAGLWSTWASVRVQVAYTSPATPTIALTPDNTAGTISVAVTNPAPTGSQPTVASWDVHRRVGATGTSIRIARNQTGTYVDRTPASGVDYRYMVRATGTTGTTADSAWST